MSLFSPTTPPIQHHPDEFITTVGLNGDGSPSFISNNGEVSY
jgi:hypothetical protein